MLMPRSLLAGLSFHSSTAAAISSALDLNRSLTTSCRALFAASSEQGVTAQDGLPSTSGRSSSAPGTVNWNWKWVLGKSLGRKPAIKRPSRHQWLYCNPNYNPSAPLPAQPRSPYAPPEETLVPDSATIKWHLKQQPENRKDKRNYLRSHRRFEQLREMDWREAFQRGVAADTRAFQKRKRLQDEERRQDSWKRYKEALFEVARLEAGRTR